MPTYRVTPKIIELVQQLLTEGYSGTIELTDKYATGTREVLGQAMAVQLSGFCKEHLYLVEDIEVSEILFVGRYGIKGIMCFQQEATVRDIVQLAWQVYQSYKHRGYTCPDGFVALFLKYGYLEEQTKTVLVEKK